MPARQHGDEGGRHEVRRSRQIPVRPRRKMEPPKWLLHTNGLGFGPARCKLRPPRKLAGADATRHSSVAARRSPAPCRRRRRPTNRPGDSPNASPIPPISSSATKRTVLRAAKVGDDAAIPGGDGLDGGRRRQLGERQGRQQRDGQAAAGL